MKFSIKEPNKNILFLVRRLGYVLRNNEEGECNCVRSLSNMGYPRFHLFIRKDNDRFLALSLHLDQKKPSYKGSSAHSGEYQGELVEKEKERIVKLIEDFR